jgi:hypothetical protein
MEALMDGDDRAAPECNLPALTLDDVRPTAEEYSAAKGTGFRRVLRSFPVAVGVHFNHVGHDFRVLESKREPDERIIGYIPELFIPKRHGANTPAAGAILTAVAITNRRLLTLEAKPKAWDRSLVRTWLAIDLGAVRRWAVTPRDATQRFSDFLDLWRGGFVFQYSHLRASDQKLMSTEYFVPQYCERYVATLTTALTELGVPFPEQQPNRHTPT